MEVESLFIAEGVSRHERHALTVAAKYLESSDHRVLGLLHMMHRQRSTTTASKFIAFDARSRSVQGQE